MKKRIWIIVSIVAVVALCAVLLFTVLREEEPTDVSREQESTDVSREEELTINILYWWADGKNPKIDMEYVDPDPNEKTLDLIKLAESLNYTEVSDETLSALAKLTLSLFDEYDKILVRRTFYTDWLERGIKDSPTDHKTDKVVVYCDDPKDDDHALVFLGLMIELFDQDMYLGDQIFMEHMGTINREMAPYMIFSTNYKNMGFKTIDDYRKKLVQINDEIIAIHEEIEKLHSKDLPLYPSDESKYQQFGDELADLYNEKAKLFDGYYIIRFDRLTVTRKDGIFDDNEDWNEFGGDIEWNTVAELASIG